MAYLPYFFPYVMMYASLLLFDRSKLDDKTSEQSNGDQMSLSMAYQAKLIEEGS